MPRIPTPELERLKADVSVQRLVEEAGIVLKKSGKDWLGCCPFHEDAEPSLVVTPAKNLWHCFGCQVGGGPIDWVMKFRGVSFRHAVELLKADPSLAAFADRPVKRATARALPAPVSLDADDQALLDDTIAYYHTRLKENPEALAYLAARGLNHPELIDTFRLGFADRTLGLRLPDKKNKTGEALRTALQRVGLLRESGHEHFNGSLVIPVFDEAGHVVEIYGRKIHDNLRAGTPKHLYLPGPHRGVFNRAGLVGQRDIVLCEALIDALTFWCAGICNVTTAYGVEGFTDEVFECLKASGAKRILIAFDGDEAGDRAAERLTPRLVEAGFEVLRLKFPAGLDANSFAQSIQPPERGLRLLMRQAHWLGGVTAVEPEPESLPDASLPQQPPESAVSVPVAVPEGDLHLEYETRRYRVRGWEKALSAESLRINLLVSRGEHFHVDTLDLYSAKARAQYIKQASIEVCEAEDTIKHDLGRVLIALEQLQAERLKSQDAARGHVPAMTEAQYTAAMALLKSPDLMSRIQLDFASIGIVGEESNTLVGYLAATSRLLDRPLAVLIQSSSAAGKSSLMDAILSLMPDEAVSRYSAMSGQSIFYMGQSNLKNKILAIAEEEGATNAAYALKLLQSDGRVSMASTGKDPETGRLTTHEYCVEGPVMLFMTTTAIDIDEELLNRCLVLSVNESREQTRAIFALQRKRQTLAGLIQSAEREDIISLHRNAQRLLRPLAVVNPFADELTFLDHKTRARRDHMKYLSLIAVVALLHQCQREVKSVEHGGKRLEYIEVSRTDIEIANRLAHEVLGRTLDELPPQTRKLLSVLHAWAPPNRADWRFSRRQLREHCGWGDTQLKVHLARLVDLEYLIAHRGMVRNSLDYELRYQGEGEAGASFVLGLGGYDDNRSGWGTNQSAP
ncbi:MAG: primase, partial [Pseudomonadota bacterium]